MLYSLTILAAFVTSLAFTIYLLPRIIKMAYKKKLFDLSDERKIHKSPIPRLGGLVFVPSMIVTISLLFGFGTMFLGNYMITSFSLPKVSLTMCAFFIIYIVGVADDLVGVGYKRKFLTQFFCATLIAFSGIWINSFQGFLGLRMLPTAIGVILTICLIVFIINAINLIDGIDGLSSGLGLISLVELSLCFAYIHRPAYVLMAVVCIGTILPFYYFNTRGSIEKKSKVFMGDCGSLSLGLILAFLAVRLARFYPNDSIRIHNCLLVAASTVMLPCLDALRVMAVRIVHGKNPFKADKQHLHHLLLSLGCSHAKARYFMFALSIALFLLTMGLSWMGVNINLVFIADVILWLSVMAVIYYKIRNHK